MNVADHLIVSVHPQDLTFQFELEKPSYCDLKVTNNTEHHVAFKVKTTSPKKYFVRPNKGIMHPLDSCVIRVTLQAQRECPPNMQCKDKFLLQSTVVHPNTNTKELPHGTFDKEAGNNALQEYKLRVVYVTPRSANGDFKDGPNRNLDANSATSRADPEIKLKGGLQASPALKKIRPWATFKRRSRESLIGMISIKWALVVGLVGIIVGFLYKKSSSLS